MRQSAAHSLARASRKKKTFRAEERDRPDVVEKRRNFLFRLAKLEPRRLVFLDEAGMNLAMTRTMGYAPAGARCYAKKPGKRSNISVIGAVRLSGPCAFYPYDGAVNAERFLAYLEHQLLPLLDEDDVLVMDNVRFHHDERVESLCEKFGVHVIYLPPYAPELNPIEEVWSQVKRFFRDIAARTIEDFVDGIRALQDVVRPNDLHGYFTHASYLQAK